ncbi:MAG: cytochrome c-type biogenesis protein CcmH [Actinobacteria bacterium]|nr:cytochrome c-type biogenesis protein CcmH [Actinomycetota bacterium]
MSAAKKFSSRLLPWALLAVVIVVAFVVGAHSAAKPSLAERTRSVADTIRCPQCTDKSMAASDAPTSVAGRAEIQRQLVAGRTPDEVRAWFAARYGQDILLTPPRRGVEGLIWMIPVIAFVVAAAVLSAAFLRWRRIGAETATDADVAVVAAALDELHTRDVSEGDGS